MKMNQKGFANIVVIIFVVVVVGVIGYMALINKPVPISTNDSNQSQQVTGSEKNAPVGNASITQPDTVSPKPTEIPYTTIKDFVCKAGGGEKDISSPTNALVVESRQRIINLGVSGSYFDDHFELVCGKILRSGNPEITWRYAIGEFMVGISDRGTRFPGLALENTVGQLHEIQHVVSQEKALASMQSCVGDFGRPSIVFGLVVDLPTSKQTGLYLAAQPTRKARSGFHEIAFVNLETGLCKVVERENPPPLP